MSACAGMFLPVFAWGGTDVNIDNPLAECVDIHPVHRQEMDNLTILKTTVTLKKSTGECGCFSTLINYTSLLAQDVEGYGRGSAYSFRRGISHWRRCRDVILSALYYRWITSLYGIRSWR